MLPTTNRIREIEDYPVPRLQPREVALLPEHPPLPSSPQGRDDFGTLVLFFLLLGLLLGGR